MKSINELPLYLLKKYGTEHVLFKEKRREGIIETTVKSFVGLCLNVSELLKKFELLEGDRVISVMHNSVLWHALEVALFNQQLIHVPISGLMTRNQLEQIVVGAAPNIIIVDTVVRKKQLEAIVTALKLRISVYQLF
ncbi:MAG: AMP-binding protein [Bacteroidetes bacterium]|nr:AMP-binding protein [Bacteroidota bacterium]